MNKSFRGYIAEKFDKKSIRILIAIFIALPMTAYTVVFGFLSIMFGITGLISYLDYPSNILEFTIVALFSITPTLGALGVLGAWFRIIYAHNNLSPKFRIITVIFLSCGLIASSFFTFLAINEERLTTLGIFGIPTVMGVLMILGTPKVESSKSVVIIKEEDKNLKVKNEKQ